MSLGTKFYNRRLKISTCSYVIVTAPGVPSPRGPPGPVVHAAHGWAWTRRPSDTALRIAYNGRHTELTTPLHHTPPIALQGGPISMICVDFT